MPSIPMTAIVDCIRSALKAHGILQQNAIQLIQDTSRETTSRVYENESSTWMY